MSDRYTDDEIERVIIAIAQWRAPSVADDAAGMLRQLLAERRASEKERGDDATPEDSSEVRDTMTVAEAEAWATRAARIMAMVVARAMRGFDEGCRPEEAVELAIKNAGPFNSTASAEVAAAVARARGERE